MLYQKNGLNEKELMRKLSPYLPRWGHPGTFQKLMVWVMLTLFAHYCSWGNNFCCFFV